MLNKSSVVIKGLRLGWLIVSLVALSACNGNHQIKKFREHITQMKQSSENASNHDNTLPITAPVPMTYHAKTLRSPFEDLQGGVSNKPGEGLNPLYSYPVNMLKFVGTVTRNNVSFAFLQAPDNKLYEVKKGDKIGNHSGKIINIYPDRIEVKEMSSESGKPGTESLITLQLKEKHT